MEVLQQPRWLGLRGRERERHFPQSEFFELVVGCVCERAKGNTKLKESLINWANLRVLLSGSRKWCWKSRDNRTSSLY